MAKVNQVRTLTLTRMTKQEDVQSVLDELNKEGYELLQTAKLEYEESGLPRANLWLFFERELSGM